MECQSMRMSIRSMKGGRCGELESNTHVAKLMGARAVSVVDTDFFLVAMVIVKRSFLVRIGIR